MAHPSLITHPGPEAATKPPAPKPILPLALCVLPNSSLQETKITRHKVCTHINKSRKTNRKRTRAAETINRLNTQTSDAAIPLLDIYTINTLAHIHRDRYNTITKIRYIKMFIAALFITVKKWEQLKCQSIGNWLE